MGDCLLCLKPSDDGTCYVRLHKKDLPSCRNCWEQLLLDPARILRQIRSEALERVWMDPAYMEVAGN